MKTYLGMDFGGTKLLIGEVDAEGTVLRSRRYATGFTRQAEKQTRAPRGKGGRK